PGQRFHSDVCHIKVPSWDGFLYFITFKDESSGYRRVFFLRSLQQVSSAIKSFFSMAERETGRKAISLRSDNGTEYINKAVGALLSSLGITHERSPPYVKQANGMAERENRTLCDTARSLLFNADLTKKERDLLWAEAVATAAYLRNRIPNRGKRD